MRKFYSGFLSAILFTLASFVSSAQITITTATPPDYLYNSATASGAIVFGVKNSNSFPITITEIGNYMPEDSTSTFTLSYHTTAVTGAPTAINTTNGWVSLPPVTITNNPSS